jgi:hypothetical protein
LIQGEFLSFVSFLCFELFFAILVWVATFRAFYLGVRFLLLLYDLLELFLTFGLLAALHGGLDSRFKLCAFCCQWTH